MAHAQIDGILDFWFADAVETGQPQKHWFTKDDAFDARIRERFGDDVEAALRGERDGWAATPRGRLALLILLDQFTRNIFRGTARAFAGDAQALALALEGLERGDDRALAPLQRVFCYLPLEHAEDPAMQVRAVALFTQLRDSVPAVRRDTFEGFLDYARQHRDVIDRFGRFPHRNAVLGRTNRPEENDYLAQPGAGF